MASASQLRVKVGADVGDAVAGLRQVDQAATRTAESITRAGGAAKTAGAGFSSLTSGLGSAVAGLTGFGAKVGMTVFGIQQLGNTLGSISGGLFGYNARIEQLSVAFTGLLGSAQQASAFMKQMQQFAAVTPFEMTQVADAAQKLVGAGMAAKDVIPALTAIGDAVSGVGGSAAEIDRVTMALTQMMSAGKIQGQDMLQLAQANVAPWQRLAEATGKSIQELHQLSEAGQLDAQTYVPMLIQGMEARFKGQMEAQSHTFSGMISSIKDNLNQGLGAVTAPAFKEAEAQLTRFLKFTEGPAFKEIGAGLADDLKGAVHSIGDFVANNGVQMVHTIEGAASAALQLAGAMAQVASFVGQANEALGGKGFELLAGLYGAGKLVGLAGSVTGALAGAGTAAAAGAGATEGAVVAGLLGGAAAGTVVVTIGTVLIAGAVAGVATAALTDYITRNAPPAKVQMADELQHQVGPQGPAVTMQDVERAQRSTLIGPPVPSDIQAQMDARQRLNEAVAPLTKQGDQFGAALRGLSLPAVNSDIDQASQSLAQFASIGDTSFSSVNKDIDQMSQAISDFSAQMGELMKDALPRIQGMFDDYSKGASDNISVWQDKVDAAQRALDMLDEKRKKNGSLNEQEKKQYDDLKWAVDRYKNGLTDDLEPAYIAAQDAQAKLTKQLDDLNQAYKDGKINQDQYNAGLAAIAEQTDPMAGMTAGIAESVSRATALLNNLLVDLGILPESKRIKIEVDAGDAKKGADDAKGAVDGVPDNHTTTLDAVDSGIRAGTQGAKEDIGSVPDNHQTTFTGETGGLSGATDASDGFIAGVPGSHNTSFTGDSDGVGGAAGEAHEQVSNVPTGHETTFTGNTDGVEGASDSTADFIAATPTSHETTFTGDTGPFDGATAHVDEYQPDDKTATVTANASAAYDVFGDVDAWQPAPKVVQVTASFQGGGAGGGFASGGRVSNTMVARVGELGPELAIYPYAGAFASGGTVGMLSNGLALLPKGTEVIPADQTRSILDAADVASAIVDGLTKNLDRLPDLLGQVDDQVMGEVAKLRDKIAGDLDLAKLRGDDQETLDKYQGQLDAIGVLVDGWAQRTGKTISGVFADALEHNDALDAWQRQLSGMADLFSGDLIPKLNQDAALLSKELQAAIASGAPQEVIDDLQKQLTQKQADVKLAGQILTDAIAGGIIDDPQIAQAWKTKLDELPGIISGDLVPKLEDALKSAQDALTFALAAGAPEQVVAGLREGVRKAQGALTEAQAMTGVADQAGLVKHVQLISDADLERVTSILPTMKDKGASLVSAFADGLESGRLTVEQVLKALPADTKAAVDSMVEQAQAAFTKALILGEDTTKAAAALERWKAVQAGMAAKAPSATAQSGQYVEGLGYVLSQGLTVSDMTTQEGPLAFLGMGTPDDWKQRVTAKVTAGPATPWGTLPGAAPTGPFGGAIGPQGALDIVATAQTQQANAQLTQLASTAASVPTDITITAHVAIDGAIGNLNELNDNLPHSPAKKGPFSTLPNWDAVFGGMEAGARASVDGATRELNRVRFADADGAGLRGGPGEFHQTTTVNVSVGNEQLTRQVTRHLNGQLTRRINPVGVGL